MRKNILKILIICISVTFALGIFTACDNNGENLQNDNHNHNYTATITEPTCTEQGYTTYTCECGESYKDNFTNALGHDYVWTTTKQPTETAKGTETGVCSRCQGTITRDIPELNHEHSYTETIVAPTCTAKGYTLHKCSCGYEYRTDETEKIPHSPAVAVEENRIEAKCEKNGSYDSVVYCAVCGTELSRVHNEINETGHDYGAWIETTPPTCTAKGVETRYCSHDHSHTETRDIPKLQHEFTNYVSDNNATYDDDGTKTAYCNHGCGAKDTVTDIGTKLKSGISFKTLTVNGNSVSGKVANNVTTYSFINEITTTGNVTYSVSYDINGNNTIPSKTTNINEGDNVFYVLEKVNGEVTNLFTVNVRRREIYDVTFNANGGTAVDPQRIEEDDFATEPTTTRAGYTFTEWDYIFGNPITSNTVITAGWAANSDTKYKAEYYLQNLADDNYTLDFTDDLTGETDTQASAEIKTYNHFTYNANKSIVSGNINGNGTTVLKVYYTRDKYTYSVINENTKGGTINCTSNGTYKYEKSIELSATVNVGYDFIGWYINGNVISDELNHSFTLSEVVSVTARYFAHIDTPYKVEYYLQNLADNNYTLDHTDNLTGTTDTNANAEIKTFKHFTHIVISNSKESANINGNENTVLKVYYTRDEYSVRIASYNSSVNLDKTYNDRLKYGYEINIVSNIDASNIGHLGYECGWYSDGVVINALSSLQGFIVDKDIVIVVKNVKDEMLDFNFTSTTTTCEITGIKDKTVTKITIPDYVTSIGEWAFYQCENIKSIIIPDSVTSIGSGAFSGCSKLTSITIPVNVTSICDSVFYGCSSLTSITIPDSVTSIGNQAFYLCSSLTSMTIPDGVTIIGNNAFYNCKSLTSIAIGGIVTSIGYNAFCGCSNLTSITIPDSVTSIGSFAFYGCSSLTSATIGENSRLTSIGSSAFSNCSSLMSITISNSVKTIGDYAFGGCNSLSNITVDSNNTNYKSVDGNLYTKDGKTLKQYAIGKAATEFTIPDSVTSIGYNAFCGCSNLTSITIPNSVTSIGNSAFYGCGSLSSITIPDSVTSIGERAFSGCSKLTSITIPFVGSSKSATSVSSKTLFGYIFGSSSYAGGTAVAQYYGSDYTTYCIPSSLKTVTVTGGSLLYGAFYNCSGLTNIAIADSVISIGDSVFRGCSSLTGVTIPDSATSIGKSAFYNCSSLTSVTIGCGITSIGDSAFYNCSSLTSIIVKSENTKYHSSDNCLIETESKTLILGCKNSIIPSDGSVTSIGSGAFSNCSGLTTITIPDSVTSIGDAAFYNCSSLTGVTIPNSVTSIGSSAFYGCSSLTTITIPDSVTSIGYYNTFRNCSKLTSVTIGNGVSYIGESAFSGCSILTSITIPDGVTSIANLAFYGCSKLTSITIPDSVTSIGDCVFYGCSKLTSIYYSGAKWQWNAIFKGRSWKYNVPTYCTVHCTDGAKDI